MELEVELTDIEHLKIQNSPDQIILYSNLLEIKTFIKIFLRSFCLFLIPFGKNIQE